MVLQAIEESLSMTAENNDPDDPYEDCTESYSEQSWLTSKSDNLEEIIPDISGDAGSDNALDANLIDGICDLETSHHLDESQDNDGRDLNHCNSKVSEQTPNSGLKQNKSGKRPRQRKSNAAHSKRCKKPKPKDKRVLKFKGLDDGSQETDTLKSTIPRVSQQTLAKAVSYTHLTLPTKA